MTKTDKDERLANRVQVGDRLRAFADDPLVTAWFEKAIGDATAAMVEAAVKGDGATAIHKGLAVQVITEVRNLMKHAVAEGNRAAEELQKRRQRSEA
jgi:hypothetical protein